MKVKNERAAHSCSNRLTHVRAGPPARHWHPLQVVPNGRDAKAQDMSTQYRQQLMQQPVPFSL